MDPQVGADANTYQYDFTSAGDDVDACFRTGMQGLPRQNLFGGEVWNYFDDRPYGEGSMHKAEGTAQLLSVSLQVS